MGDAVPKKIEEALFYQLKQKGFEACQAYSAAYADCCRGRVISMAWACRKQLHELSDCMGTHTGRLEELKQRYVAMGSPTHLDEAIWQKLLDGL
eukprot:scaffold7.g3617.t1